METKTCTICKQDLPKTIEYFATRADRKFLTYQSSCRECHKQYRKNHYESNKAKYINKAKLYTDNVINWFQDLKKNLCCIECGERRWWVLDFHHRDPSKKDGNIGLFVRHGSKKKLIKEMEKCDVLCSNCHRDLHHKERLAE